MRASFARMAAITRKEFVHIRRDPRMLISVLVMPILQLLLFAYAISFDVKDVPTVVLDSDRTPASREFVAQLENSSFFRVIGRVDGFAQIDRTFDSNKARVAVIVAPGFESSQLREQKGQVAVLVDGSEPNSAQLGQTYAVALTQQFDRQVLTEWAQRSGLEMSAVGQAAPVIRTWYNPERRSADFLMPGLMVVIIMIVTIQQTAVTLVREKDEGTLEQLVVSPIRKGELMVGKMAPWVLLAFLDMFAITLVALFVFGVPLRGSVLALTIGTLLFVFCSLALGLLVGARAQSPEVANFLGLMVSFLPGFMLSGFAFPLASIPPLLQFVSYLFPGRYMVTITRAVFLKGAGLDVLWPQIGALALYAVVSLSLASLLYSRKV